MIVGAKQMACGGCGNGQFRVFTTSPDQLLLIECTECKSVSTVTVAAPKLEIGWGENATGRLTVATPLR